MKNISKVLLCYFVVQLGLQNSLGCAANNPRLSITRFRRTQSNNLENVMNEVIDEKNQFEAFQIRYNKSYLDDKEVSES